MSRNHAAESRAADQVAEAVVLHRFRYVPNLGWLRWDERRWDADAASEEAVHQVVREHIDATEKELRMTAARQEACIKATYGDRELSKEDEKQLEKAVAEQAATAEQANLWHNLLTKTKISAVVTLCRRIPGVLTKAKDLDCHPDLLNVLNGVVDLRTGNLKDHDPGLLMTHLAGAAYDPDATCARWDQALQAVDPDCVEFLQVRMGQSLTGYTPDDDSLVLSEGGGENGKTTVMVGLTRAAGSYFGFISHRVLIAQPGQHPTELMDLRGVRFALLEETPEEGRLDTHQLKMTVGTPQITARHMRRDSVTFQATHTLWINTNHTPQVDATDHGTWRRLKRLRWPYKFVAPGTAQAPNERDGDKSLRPAMQIGEDVPGAALAWMVRGAVRWYQQRGDPMADPEAVRRASREWRTTSDIGFLFASDYLIADPTRFITAETMRVAFGEFLKAQGKRGWSSQTINARLPDSIYSALGFVPMPPTKSSKVRHGERASLPQKAEPYWHVGDPHHAERDAPDLTAGKVVRMWRGLRFRTDAERRSESRRERREESHLKAVDPS